MKEPRTELLCAGCTAPLPPSWFVVGAVGELLVLVPGLPGYGIDWRGTNRPSSGMAVCLAGLPTPSGCFQTGSRNETVFSGCVTGSRNETVTSGCVTWSCNENVISGCVTRSCNETFISSAGCSCGRSAALGVLLAAAVGVLLAAALGVLQLLAFLWLCSSWHSVGCSSWRSAGCSRSVVTYLALRDNPINLSSGDVSASAVGANPGGKYLQY